MFVPRLGVRKRTRQLRDAEEVVLRSDGTEAGTIHTTRGDYAMNGDDNAELSHNLRSARRAGAVTKIAEAVYAQAAEFFEATVLSVAKARAPIVLDAYARGDLDAFTAWMSRTGFTLEQDGLRSVVKMGEAVLAYVETEVEPLWRAEVENFIRSTQSIMRAGERRAAA